MKTRYGGLARDEEPPTTVILFHNTFFYISEHTAAKQAGPYECSGSPAGTLDGR